MASLYENILIGLSKEIKSLPGKSNKENSSEWLPTWMHSVDTCIALRYLINRWIAPSFTALIEKEIGWGSFKKICDFIALTHDTGKMTPGFVNCIADSVPETCEQLKQYNLNYVFPPSEFKQKKEPHALASAVLLVKELGENAEGVAAIVGAHHGRPISNDIWCDISCRDEFAENLWSYYSTANRESKEGQTWEAVWKEWIGVALKYAGFKSAEELPLINYGLQVLLCGLLIMADWLASNPTYFPLVDIHDSDILHSCENRVETAEKKLSGFLWPWEPTSYTMDQLLFIDRFGFAPNPVQQAMIEAAETAHGPGIFILEAQMGVGKTEAALAAAEILASNCGCSGVFLGLPTQATANGIFPRLVAWGRSQSEYFSNTIRLAHGMASLNNEYRDLFVPGSIPAADEDNQTGLFAHQWFEGRKQALLANFTIGTVDQLLIAALKQKHVMLRHVGLVGKVVIIDECHAYDAYMNQYLEQALAWLGAYGAPVIMLSATLPPARRQALIKAYTGSKTAGDCESCQSYPLLTWAVDGEVHCKEISASHAQKDISIGFLDDEGIDNFLKEKLSDGGCAGIILNTVQRAQTVAELLREVMPDKEVILIHSRFIMTDRAEREKYLLEKIGKYSTAVERNGVIVVGTQVVEQSLDIDFDVMMTDLCPMDLLLQRIGRLHRHNRSRPNKLERPQCMVLQGTGVLESGAAAIYGEWLLERTKELLPDVITLPSDIPALVRDAYADVNESFLSAEKVDLYNKHRDKIKEKESRAKGFRLGKPTGKKHIVGMLDTAIDNNDKKALAAVRDSGQTITVFVMVLHDENTVSFLPWQSEGDVLRMDYPPSSAEGRKIASQQLKLPAVFSAPYNIDRTIKELEEMNNHYVSDWQESRWIKGELVLLLDKDLKTSLAGYEMSYSQQDGLKYKKKELYDERA